jgi:Family of unknown function (DUF5706)
MLKTQIKYHQAALIYLQNYYQSFTDDSICFGFSFINDLVTEGKKIARAAALENVDYDNALVIICFRFAGITNIFIEDDVKFKLLQDFAALVNYPADWLNLVDNVIRKNIQQTYPVSAIERVAWDALSCRFAMDDFIVHASFLREEINRLSKQQYTELEILTVLKEHFLKSNFITDFAKTHYSDLRDRNFIRLDKRIEKLQEAEKKVTKTIAAYNLTDKETEDLFKLAFRNYSHLVSVADTKAGILIKINSLIISVIIAFVVRGTEKILLFTVPVFILLTVAFITILISILASRPQRNKLVLDKSSGSHQTFFFGSFDLIGNDFLKVSWENYTKELDDLLKGGRERIYEEMYKEAFNVRKVLGKKFTYLSVAYWVFITGLFISIVSFFISAYQA